MSKSVTEHQSRSDIFVCKRCKHQFIGSVAHPNKLYCEDCRKQLAVERHRARDNSVAFNIHVSHATTIIDNFLHECRDKKPNTDKKFVKISEVLFWAKEHPDNIPKYWTSDRVIRRWITQTLKTNYPYKPFMVDVYIRDD